VIERIVRVLAHRLAGEQAAGRGMSMPTDAAGSGRVQILPK
jgi:hypothetical protein